MYRPRSGCRSRASESKWPATRRASRAEIRLGIFRLHVAGFELRNVEKVVDVALEGARVAGDDSEVTARLVGGVRRGEHALRGPDDQRERSPQFVTDVREELRLQLVELLGLLV